MLYLPYEIRRDVIGYEGLYMVSNLGDVMSLFYRSNGSNRIQNKRHKVLSVCYNSTGYRNYVLTKDGIKTSIRGHKIVALAFLNNKELEQQINHKDGDKNNNSVNNLERCSPSYNQQHRFKNLGHKLSTQHIAALSNSIKRKVRKIDDDGKCLGVYLSISDAAREHGVMQSGISRSLSSNSLKSGGFRWAYVLD